MPMTAADLTVKVGADTSDFEQGMGKVDGTLNKSKARMGAATGILGGGALAIGGGFLYAANSAMNFEGAMADVDASLMPTTQQLAALEKEALRIGATTTFNATEGAQAIEQLGLAGISIPDIMNGGAMSVARLASATGEDLPNSATAMANAMTIFGIAGSDTEAVADTMTAALNESSMTLTDFQQGMASAGVMADSVGMSFEQTSAALALFSANGMSGADAGTSLRSMLTHMANPTAEASALFDQLGFSLQEGIDSGNLMGYTAEKLTAGLAHMSEEERLAALNTMFGADAQRVANILYGEGAAGVNEMTEKMKANGQAQEAARRRMGGLRGAMESLSGSVETAAIIIGSGLTPFLTVLAEKVGDAVNWLTNLPEPLIRIISVVAAVVGALMGLGAAFGSVMMMGGLIPGGFGAVGSAMLAILGPVALVVAAAIGLYIAFETNFMGLRDIVMGAVDAITGAFSALSDILMGTITGDLERVKEGFENLAEPLQPLGEFVGDVTQSFVDLYDAFEAGGISGLIDALPGALGDLGGAFADLGSAIMTGIGNIDWGGLASGLGDFASAAGSWLSEQLGRVPWAELFQAGVSALSSAGSWVADKLGDAATAIGSWLSEQLGKVDWAGLFAAGLAGLSSAGAWIAEKMGEAATAIGTWLTNQINAVDWAGKTSAIGTKLKSAFTSAINNIVDFGTTIGTWIGRQVDGVNWGGVVTKMGTAFKGAVTDAVNGITGLYTTILTWITGQIESVDWNSVGTTAANLLVGGIKASAGLIGLAAYFLGQFMLAMVDVNWSAVATAVKDFLVAAIKALAGFFTGFATTLYTELKAEISNVDWGGIGSTLKTQFVNAAKGIGSAIGAAIFAELPGWAQNIINGIMPGSEGGYLDSGTGYDPAQNGLIAGQDYARYPTPYDQRPKIPEGQPTTDATGRPIVTALPSTGSGGQMASNAPPPAPDPGPWLAFGDAVNSAKSSVVSFVADTIGVMGGWLGGILTMVSTFTASFHPPISAGTSAGKQSFITFVADTIGVMGGWIGGISTMMSTFASSFHPPISTGTSSGKQSFITFVADTIGVMGGWVGGINTMVNSTMSQMQSRVSTGTSTSKQSFITFVADTIGVMGGWVGGINNMVNSTMSNMQSRVSSGTSTSKQSFVTFVGDTIGVMGGWSSGVGNIVSNAMSNMASTVRRGASDAASAMRNGMAQATSAISSESGRWAGIVNSAAGSLGAAGFNAGAAAGYGVANGLNSALGAVQAAAAAIASAAAAAMDLALEVASPSKVTRRTGRFAGQGLAGGILDLRPQVEANAREVAKAAARAFAIDAVTPVMAVEGPAYQQRPRGLMQARSGEAPQYVYNDHRAFTVKVDDLPELVRAKEFFDDIERDREMMYGGH